MSNYKPSFDALGNSQAIIVSDRVIILGKNDCVFILGKKAVSISSPGPANIDSDTSITLRAPKVKLGLTGNENGEPVLLGNKTVDTLTELLQGLLLLTKSLSTASESGWANAVISIRPAAKQLNEKIQTILKNISYSENKSIIQSKSTFTK